MKIKAFGWNVTGWSMIAFYLVCGLLLLLWPDLALTVANYALAAILCIVGIAGIIGYLRSEAVEGMLGYGLTKGLILTLLGLLLLIQSDTLKMLLPRLWGLAMIAGGLGKFQMAFDLKRIGQERWWLLLLGALVSLALGLISLLNPALLAIAALQFAGIALLTEAVLDTASLLWLHKTVKQLKVEWHAK
ncbi:MAG: hypothetical protein GX418_07005 [Clostridiales bacterium]|nr:hypothetical protein [Clostridiales bacterium]